MRKNHGRSSAAHRAEPMTDTDIASTFASILTAIEETDPVRVQGKITEVIGLLIESNGPSASVGDVCTIEQDGEAVGRAEVVGFRKERTLLMPLGPLEGIHPGLTVVSTKHPLMVNVGDHLLGRVLNGLGDPIDGKGELASGTTRATFSKAPHPLTRKLIKESFVTGIRSIDSMLTLGKGQRCGIFSGSGVGKSVMLGMVARHCASDVNVIALVGERGREVREFLEGDLGEEGLRRSVVVVATSEEPALIRIKGALVAATIAEYFRDQGKHVLFLCDSLSRLATAQREIGLAVGEPPATKGFTPSVFSLLPKFVERAGTAQNGSITALYTVLVEGDDLDEPVSDAARSVLDGHIVLSRSLANRAHYPAVDILQSISRCMPAVISKDHHAKAVRVLNAMAAYAENEDIIQIGAYAAGSSSQVDSAIRIHEPLMSFLRQDRAQKASFEESCEGLATIDHMLSGGDS